MLKGVHRLHVSKKDACLDVFSLGILLELQFGHAVEQLGQVAHHDLGLVSVGEDIEQISRRDEVEAREGESLRLEVLSECLLAQRQLTLDGLQTIEQTRDARCFNDVLVLLYFRHDLLENKQILITVRTCTMCTCRAFSTLKSSSI